MSDKMPELPEGLWTQQSTRRGPRGRVVMAEDFGPLTVAVPILSDDEAGLIRGLDYLMQNFGMLHGREAKAAQARCAQWLAAKYAMREARDE
ncbi:hypothetical protein [Pseudoxanthomonas winnipegensis]|uniref:hypothetical protein n=1 Tax=Pseudoxanthomonas winnipegensis TaxID=2480810 RepID=UPI00102DAC82|nr:hypothetical protein [Pseudoxanthomonas winnipegensis]RZZ85643.1 hypothetical protein EA663_11570 [Pseudoxanthomonas winnipegensis]